MGDLSVTGGQLAFSMAGIILLMVGVIYLMRNNLKIFRLPTKSQASRHM